MSPKTILRALSAALILCLPFLAKGQTGLPLPVPGADVNGMCTIESKRPGCEPGATGLNLPQDTRARLEGIAKEASIQHCKTRVQPYDARAFERALSSTLRELSAKLPDAGGCHYANATSTDTALSELFQVEPSKPASDAIRSLQKQGLIRRAVARYCRKGEPDRCRRHSFHIFTSDGYVLCLEYNFASR